MGTMDAAASVRRMPNAAWAWEGLRRNEGYRRLWRRVRGGLPRAEALPTGATILREEHVVPGALRYGLLHPADPSLDAETAAVFWRPDAFARTLRVRLSPLGKSRQPADPHVDEHVVLSRLPARRVLLDTAGGERHVLIRGRGRWLQLRCAPPVPSTDEAAVGIRLNRVRGVQGRLLAAADLIDLHDEAGPEEERKARPSQVEDRLADALRAYDATAAGGSLRDVAEALFGPEIVADDWSGAGCYLKERARRARAKGEAFVASGYRHLLTKCGP